jgi:hypothetical protein
MTRETRRTRGLGVLETGEELTFAV